MNYTKIFPVVPETKIPYTEHGFKDASSDTSVQKKWKKVYPKCLWGYPTGDGVFVVDVDAKNDGIKHWKELTDQYGCPNTFTVQTQHGGYHYYFSMPSGAVVKNDQDGYFAEGIDLRGIGGYVVIPPSKGYKVVNDVDVAYPPQWVIDRAVKKNVVGYRSGFSLPDVIKDGQRNGTLFRYGRHLKGKGESDEGTRQKMIRANMERCSIPLSDDELDKIIESVLRYGTGNVNSRNQTPADYRNALIAMGYEFQLNIMDDSIYINGHKMSDIDQQEILYFLGNDGYTSKDKTEQAYTFEASEHRFHPIQDYLQSLTWDGQDHIGKLCSYIKDEDNIFATWFKRWLIGSVAKVLPSPRGVQNRVLVLNGSQNLGKSFFVRWLAQDVRDFYIEAAIEPDDKDDYVRKMNKWVWEVAELGATTRKADLEQLKQFISREWIDVRPPFGRFDLHKPSLSNFIGTINPEGTGFLNDSTGNRRFMVCTLTDIDWNYSKDIRPRDVWAQAVALFESGEPWDLQGDEVKTANEINSKHEVDSTIGQYLSKYFEISPSDTESKMPTAEIVDVLKLKGAISTGEKAVQMEISRYLTQQGLNKVIDVPAGYSNRVRVWVGIKTKMVDDMPIRELPKMPMKKKSRKADY
jgi:Virulence-associated protein E-like domain/Bifunctional DNA primase/polymerase, N-terminal/Primase C terminal 1 (PriCT-1)